jgi:periplasmic protein TonB
MSVHFLKISDFPVSTTRNLKPVRNQKSASGLLTVVNADSRKAVAMTPNQAVKRSASNLRDADNRREYLIGFLLTLALHLLWLFTAPMAETRETIEAPKPIMVEWLGNSPNHEEPVKPQASRETPKPVVKPKSQPQKAEATPPKQLVAAASTTAESNIAQPRGTPVTPPAVAHASPVTATAPDSVASNDTPVTLPHLNADYLNNPAPDYPSVSRQLGEQGRVLLRAMINAEGSVEQVVLRKSSGFERLDQAALDTVKHWRFVPARRGEQQVSAWVVVPVSFTLEG